MTTDELNRQCAERLGWKLHSTLSDGSEFWRPSPGVPMRLTFATDYNAARSLLDGMSEEESVKFHLALIQVLNLQRFTTFHGAIMAIVLATPAQLCEAWLRATEGRAGAGSRKEEA